MQLFCRDRFRIVLKRPLAKPTVVRKPDYFFPAGKAGNFQSRNQFIFIIVDKIFIESLPHPDLQTPQPGSPHSLRPFIMIALMHIHLKKYGKFSLRMETMGINIRGKE
jgi:hypothetical protein